MSELKNNTLRIIKKYNVKAKKGFGQNFLIDDNVLRKIIEISNITKDTGVIEIGPGIGSLTTLLLQNAKKVLAYEIDKDMVAILNEELAGYNNLKLVNKDFLETDLSLDLEYFADCEEIIVVSNLPYYITTPIITKFLEKKTDISRMCLMVQKEVAERLTAKPKTKEYGSLSVFIKYKGSAKLEFSVSRNSFYPVPNVDSGLICIKYTKNDLRVINEPHFLQYVRAIFNQKRKTFSNNFNHTYSISKEEIANTLKKLNHSINIRSEELSLEEIHNLYLEFFKE